MNDFDGLLATDFGFKAQGKSAPMAASKGSSNFATSSSRNFDLESRGTSRSTLSSNSYGGNFSDDDFQILIDEYDRLCSSPFSTPSRIRVFLFPNSGRCAIHHPKTESWFFDALKSAKIMQKGRHCLMGSENEAHGYSSVAGAGVEGRHNGGELSHGLVSSGAESVVLEPKLGILIHSSSSWFKTLERVKV